MYYKNQHIGGVRIGRIGQTEDRPDIPDEFETLPTDYFSLGVSLEYYKNLKREGIPRVEILIALHDIAYDLKLLETVREERVTQRSLMRDFSYYAVKEQFHRIADGGAVLTDYDFKYILPDKDITTGENLELDFYVEGENNTPPSNIYVLIGKNGIGKTTIIKKCLKLYYVIMICIHMENSLLAGEETFQILLIFLLVCLMIPLLKLMSLTK